MEIVFDTNDWGNISYLEAVLNVMKAEEDRFSVDMAKSVTAELPKEEQTDGADPSSKTEGEGQETPPAKKKSAKSKSVASGKDAKKSKKGKKPKLKWEDISEKLNELFGHVYEAVDDAAENPKKVAMSVIEDMFEEELGMTPEQIREPEDKHLAPMLELIERKLSE